MKYKLLIFYIHDNNSYMAKPLTNDYWKDTTNVCYEHSLERADKVMLKADTGNFSLIQGVNKTGSTRQ